MTDPAHATDAAAPSGPDDPERSDDVGRRRRVGPDANELDADNAVEAETIETVDPRTTRRRSAKVRLSSPRNAL